METICKCKQCGVEKHRIWHGLFLGKTTNKKWVDKEGFAWLGRRCPECKDKVYAEYRKIHYVPKPKNLVRGMEAKLAKTKRKCRRCSKFLSATRYFNCEVCILPGTSDYSDAYC